MKRLQRIVQSNEYFECITRIAARALLTRAGAVITVGLSRRELRGSVGIEELGIAEHTAFMATAAAVGEPLIVPDLEADLRFAANPLVSGPPGLRFYAGIALADTQGINVGALCLLDTRARQLTAEDRAYIAATLQDMGGLIEHELLMRSLIGTDPLTSLHTASYAMPEIEREWRRGLRNHKPMTALVIDVDHLGPYNDAFGYPAGDRALSEIADCLSTIFRRGCDLLVRLGGDRILALLMETGLDDALKIAENSRREIEAMQAGAAEHAIRLTISVGVAGYDGHVAERGGWQAMLRRADDAMRRAKLAGGNRVEADLGTDALGRLPLLPFSGPFFDPT